MKLFYLTSIVLFISCNDLDIKSNNSSEVINKIKEISNTNNEITFKEIENTYYCIGVDIQQLGNNGQWVTTETYSRIEGTTDFDYFEIKENKIDLYAWIMRLDLSVVAYGTPKFNNNAIQLYGFSKDNKIIISISDKNKNEKYIDILFNAVPETRRRFTVTTNESYRKSLFDKHTEEVLTGLKILKEAFSNKDSIN